MLRVRRTNQDKHRMTELAILQAREFMTLKTPGKHNHRCNNLIKHPEERTRFHKNFNKPII